MDEQEKLIKQLTEILSKINTLFVYSNNVFLIDRKELLEVSCKLHPILSEIERLDMTIDEDVDYFNCLKDYINDCLDKINYSNFSECALFVYPLEEFSILSRTESTIDLQWVYTEKANTRYILERSTDNVNYIEISDLEGSVKTYQDTGLNHNTLYYYRIKLVEGNIESDYLFAQEYTLHLIPSNFTVEKNSTSQLDLSWDNNNFGETGYEIEFSTDNVNFNLLTTTIQDITNFEHTGLIEGTLYYYRIRAVNTNNNNPSEYGFSQEATYLEAPTLLVDNVVGTEVELSWQDNSNVETNYVLEQSIDGESYIIISSSLPPDTETFKVLGLDETIQYFYRVKAVNLLSESLYSNIVDPITTLSTPTNLSLSVISDTEIQVSWTDNSLAEDSYELEYSFDNLNWMLVSSLPSNTSIFNHINLEGGILHYYRVKALNTVDESPYSNVESVYTTVTISIQTIGGVRNTEGGYRFIPIEIIPVTGTGVPLGRLEFSQTPDFGFYAGVNPAPINDDSLISLNLLPRYLGTAVPDPPIDVDIIIEDPTIELESFRLFERNVTNFFVSPFLYNLKLNQINFSRCFNPNTASLYDNFDQLLLPSNLKTFIYQIIDNESLITKLPDFSNIAIKDFSLSLRFNNNFSNFLLKDDLVTLGIQPSSGNTSLGQSVSQSFANGLPDITIVNFINSSTSGIPRLNFSNNPLDLSQSNNLQVLSWSFLGLSSLTLPSNVSSITSWGSTVQDQGNYPVTNPLKFGEMLGNGIITFFNFSNAFGAGWVEDINNSKFSDTLTVFRIQGTQMTGNIVVTDPKLNLSEFYIGNSDNLVNIHPTVNISGLNNVQEVYANRANITNLTLPINSPIRELSLWGNNIINVNNLNFVTQISSLNNLTELALGSNNLASVVFYWDNQPDYSLAQGQDTLFNNLVISSNSIERIFLTKLGLTGSLTLPSSPTANNIILYAGENNFNVINNILNYNNLLQQLLLPDVPLMQAIDFSSFTNLQLLSITNNPNQVIINLSSVTGSFFGYAFRSLPNLTTVNLGSVSWATNSGNINRGLFIEDCNSLTTITGLENTTLVSEEGVCSISQCSIFNSIIPLGQGNFTPRVMTLSECNFSVANIDSIINSAYTNRSKWNSVSGTKVLNISMQNSGATPSGIEQPPTGFSLGVSDGTPANAREQIYVLKFNYLWVIAY